MKGLLEGDTFHECAVSTYRQDDRSIDERLTDLLGRMTIEEKRDQLIQGMIGSDDNVNNVGTGSFCPTYGGVLGFSGSLAERNDYQRIAVEETRVGIPMIWGYDVIHGCDTCFPIPLAQAASFNPDLAERQARIAALESRARGIDWTFSPMVDVARDPRWGRIAEGYSEDVHVNAAFGAAAVRGYQGDDLAAEGSIAACAKHFVGRKFTRLV
ncbi:MAG: hypothetical protein KGY81_09820 [Phycisphaerae bacterium]|jgi:beta-glucosidase|nr:hypothetical protein [Phycisphaerae bacterium]